MSDGNAQKPTPVYTISMSVLILHNTQAQYVHIKGHLLLLYP